METSLTSLQLVRLLAEEDRRKVIAALILSDGECGVEQLIDRTALPLRSVVDATDRLLSAGLIEERDGGFKLIDSMFQQAARSENPPPVASPHGEQPPDIAKVLDVSFKEGKLVQWPSKRSKRLMVLDYLAQQFEIGRRYKELEVNEKLRAFNDDVATMRRYLVDEQFLDRGAGDYWRCGGSL